MKYLPGGLWALPSRAIIYQHQHQLSVLKSTFAVVWEVLAVLISSMLIGGSGFILFQFSLPSSVRILLFGLLNLGIIAFFVFPPRFLWRSRIDSDRRLVARLATYLDRVSELSSKTAMQSIGFSILFWIVNGAGFYVLLVSVLGSNLAFNWYEATYIYAAAWVIGFLVIVAPAGLGFRESTLVILMASSITQGEAVFIAILARLWWMIAEGLWIVLGMILYRLSYKTV